ncbi:MAG: DUF4189 domain-containing protein [Gordonia sp. (in: high G+C Gram-positive bacteria)]
MKARKFLATVGIATSLATGTALVPTAATPQAEAAGTYWGALSYNFEGRVTYAINYRTSRGAANAAKARCGYNCGYFTFRNSCGAVAYKFTYNRTRVGRAWGYQTRVGAQNAARRIAGPGSHVRGWACTAGR